MLAPLSMIQAKSSIRNMTPYQNGSHSVELIENHKKILKLDSNESTISPSPSVITALMKYLEEGPLNWYPDVESQRLKEALADYTGLSCENILTFNGSDHALETVARTYLHSGSNVLQLSPTYDHFRVYAESCDTQIKLLQEASPAEILQQIHQLVDDHTRILYLVNPNNPTGHYLSTDMISTLLSEYPHIVTIVDEAYFEFSGITSAPLINNHKNLIVTRSFSKAFGLAGLRCGYLLASKARCDEISKIRVGKNINAMAQIAATASLKDVSHMNRYVDDVLNAKNKLVEHLRNIGLEVRNTPVNFILVKVAQPKAVVDYLKSQHIYIRDRSTIPGLEGFVRITIGDSLAMKRFSKVFEQIPSELVHGMAIASRNSACQEMKISE